MNPIVVAGGPNMFRPRYIQRSQLEAAGKAPGCFTINFLPAGQLTEGSPLGIILPAETVRKLADVLAKDENYWIELDIETGKLYASKDWRDLPSMKSQDGREHG